MSAKNLWVIALLLAPCVTFAAQGDLPTKESGPYIGLGAGLSTIDTADGPTSVSGESFSYRVTGGYRFAHIPLPFNLDIDAGIEVAYVDIGEVNEQTAGADVAVKMKAIATSGIVYLPIHNNWDVFGKVGVYFWDGKVTADGVKTSDESKSDLSLALGIAWQTGTAFGVQLEIESVDAVDGIWIATLMGIYQFK